MDWLKQFYTQNGSNLWDLSHQSPLLVVLLRHAGCTFCRETLEDLRNCRHAIESTGTRLVLVHMGPEDQSSTNLFAQYDLTDVERVSDPDQKIYKAFDLRRGSIMQLFGPKVAQRALTGALWKHGVGRLAGDGFQMPGVFLIKNAKVLHQFRHQTAADRPDYVAILDNLNHNML